MKTNFATRAGKEMLHINESFIAKKMKISKFLGKYMVCISKQSKKHVEFRFGFKKYDFEKKNQFFDVFQFFFLGVAASKFNFSIFQDFKKIF